MDDDLALLLDLRLVPVVSAGPAPVFRYAQSCSVACDSRLWALGLPTASTAETGERESDEVALLTPAGPCRVCGGTTERLRLVRVE